MLEAWRLIPLHTAEATTHVALTEHMVRNASSSGPIIRWYRSGNPAIVAGPSQAAANQITKAAGIPVVRRPSGGGAVILGPGVLCLDIALPPKHLLVSNDVVTDYRWLGQTWVEALRLLNVDTTTVDVKEARRRSQEVAHYEDFSMACFGSYSPFEVVCGKQKVVGLCQVRRAEGVLLSCAIHIDAAPSDLAYALPLSSDRRRLLAAHLAETATQLTALRNPVSIEDVVGAFEMSLSHRVLLVKHPWSVDEVAQAEVSLGQPGSPI